LRALSAVVLGGALLASLGAGAVVLASPAGATSSTWYVAAGGSGAACTEVDPCATVSQAVTDASSGDTIDVAGTIDDNVHVGISVTIQQQPGASPATVDGSAGGTSVFDIDNASATVTLSGLIIEGGTGYNTADQRDGGGIYNQGATVNVTNCVIEDNGFTPAWGATDGGGIYNGDAGTMTVTGSSITGNADEYGAGIFNALSGSLTLTDSTVSGNVASSDNAGVPVYGTGGGISNLGGLTMSGSTVSANGAVTSGGGLYEDGTGTITTSTFSNNTTATGGAIYDDPGGFSSFLTISGSTLYANSADGAAQPNGWAGYGGGIFAENETDLQLGNDTLDANQATNGGGAISAIGDTVDIGDSTFADNSTASTEGSAVYSRVGSLGVGGDIFASHGGVPQGGECNLATPSTTYYDFGYSVDDDGTCLLTKTGDVSDSSSIDGFMGTIASNGGPTETVALLPGTAGAPNPAQGVIPATFVAPDSSTPSCSQPDQRGVTRTAPCDMGAFAISSVPVTVEVSGRQVAGSASPSFSYTDDAPGGVTVTGTVACTAVGDGTSIGPSLPAGSYTVEGSSCSGLATSNPAAYTITYAGAASGYVVRPGKPAQLAFAAQPPAKRASGALFTVRVVVEDSLGDVVRADGTTVVTLALKANAGHGTLACTTNPGTVSAGSVSFKCSISTASAGTRFTIQARANALSSGTSSSIDIT